MNTVWPLRGEEVKSEKKKLNRLYRVLQPMDPNAGDEKARRK